MSGSMNTVLAEGVAKRDAMVVGLAEAEKAITVANLTHLDFAAWLYDATKVRSLVTASAVSKRLGSGYSEANLVYYNLMGQILAKSPEISHEEFTKALKAQGYKVAPVSGSGTQSLHTALQTVGGEKATRYILNASSSVDAAEQILVAADAKAQTARKRAEDQVLRNLEQALDAIGKAKDKIGKGQPFTDAARAKADEIVASLQSLLPVEESADTDEFVTV